MLSQSPNVHHRGAVAPSRPACVTTFRGPNNAGRRGTVGGDSRCSGPFRLRHMLLCMSDVDSSKSYQFSNQISKCLNVMIFRMSIECAKHVPFHDFRTKYSTQRPRGVAPGKFSLPLGHSNARWRLAFSYIFVNANS